MELGLGSTLLPGDPRLIDHIVGEVKSQGIFDQFRKDALADVDTKPAYQNLRTRVEGSVNSFLSKQTWKADLNKNQLRETLRKHISDAAYLDAGVERIVDQVVNPKIYSVFLPQIEDVVYKYLGLEKPKREKNGGSIKDLLPIDLDPVSPESDKNSLKDVSLDSVDDLMLSSKETTDQVDNPENSSAADGEKSVEEKESVGPKENVEPEVNGSELIPGAGEEEKPSCSTPPIVDIGLNDSIKSDDKTEEEEEDSPVFEPIDIMNFHESNVSNDSHLSGISELTSHRSRSPDFQINEFSRDHFDFSNQDSQFSKVSSDSRLSIVTDFGSSNQAPTPVPDTPKEEKSVDKNSEDKSKEKATESKENKNVKSSASKERETGREKSDSKAKSSKERSESRDSRSRRDRDYKKKSSDSRSDRDKSRSSRDSSDKSKEKDKDSKEKVRDEKSNSSGKESKDLKDIYKEKIRELREKKELTEKEKLNKDKDGHRSRDSKDKKDSKDSTKESKDRRDSKEHRSSSSSSRSHRHESSRSKRGDSKSSHDKKRDDRHSRDKSRSQGESDGKRSSRDDKSEKDKDSKSSQKRKESRSDESQKSSDKSSAEKEREKEKKRRDEKKSKSKDDHSSLRKSSNDRRSSDRDGSSGSNSKSSKNSCPSSSASSSKPNSSLKETGNASHSSSETSDGVDESQIEEYQNPDASQEGTQVDQETGLSGANAKRVDLGQSEISLPLKKRPLPAEDSEDSVEAKKPKREKNSKEAKISGENNKKAVPDNERVQIIEVCGPQDDDDDENEPYPDDLDINSKLEQSSGVIMEGENFLKIQIPDNSKPSLTEIKMPLKESFNEIMDADGHDDEKQKEAAVENELEKDEFKINEPNNEEKKITSDSEDEDCLYFVEDNETLDRFKLFLQSLNIDVYQYPEDRNADVREDNDEEDEDDKVDNEEEKMKQSLPNEENEEALAAAMAPPQLKRKHSTSPLSDIVLNLENNNDGHGDAEAIVADPEKDKKSEKEVLSGKKKLGRPKRQRPSVSSSSPNDDFIMPLSPESDVSATSDKISANHKDKDDKRLKSKQRYTSDDLYKPRPLFVGSSRRNRRSNQA